MRQVNEEVNPMAGLKAYFESYDEWSMPDPADHPMLGRWAEQANEQLFWLCASFCKFTFYQALINWEKVKAFTTMYPLLLPEYNQDKFHTLVIDLHQKHATDLSVFEFL